MSKVYEMLTNHVLTAIQAGTAPWRKTWKGKQRVVASYDGRRYKGINRVLLPFMAMGYSDMIFLTYKKASALGGSVKKGAKGFPVYLWNWVEKTDPATGQLSAFPIFRYYTVFNIADCEGIELPKWYTDMNVTEPNENERIESCERIVQGFKGAPEIVHGGDRACYYPSLDKVNMPNLSDFEGSEEYYSTLFHELAHSTGHTNRLNRKEVMGLDYFGSHNYSLEELTAELTSTFLCSEAGIEQKVIDNQAAYLASWFKKLQSDPKLFATAAGRAQKAADHILGTSEKVEEEA